MKKTLNKKVLLIVEDEKILIDTLEEKLLSEGFEVLKAHNGEDGLNLALSHHPDLILLDLLMPKVDGFVMLKELRKDLWGLKAKVIILTNLDKPAISNNYNNELNNISEYMIKTNWSLKDMVTEIKNKLDFVEK